MRLLLFLLLPWTLTEAGFGQSYLRNTRLCHEWNCINKKLGLLDALPPRDQYHAVVRSLLPIEWHGVIEKVLDFCYGPKTRVYTNTCPGQALTHCLVEQLIQNCPEAYLRKDDMCAPLMSLAGVKYMFSQSTYPNLEMNLPKEHRPLWFIEHYFNSKCCKIPQLFDSATLSECGFAEVIHYYNHTTVNRNTAAQAAVTAVPTKKPTETKETIKFVESSSQSADPLDCCDMSEFVQPQWRSECDFKLSWKGQDRLVIESNGTIDFVPKATTPRPSKDRMLVPESCDQTNCVFEKLNIVSESGSVDVEAYLKLLDNFTDAHPLWTKAKARVVTTCLTKPLNEYEADCEINKVLACTFDVLTENCPYVKRTDLCKHTKQDIMCQISSSKYRGKHRRDICYLPEIVHHEYLKSCGVKSISRMMYTASNRKVEASSAFWFRVNQCRDSTPSTTCVMSKMGIMNTYNFLDYFKMKDRIRQFTSENEEWKPMIDVMTTAFINIPLYKQYCSSPKKLLNVFDTMLMTCPISKRKDSPQCKKIFDEIAHLAPARNVTTVNVDQILKHFQHMFRPNINSYASRGRITLPKRYHKIVNNPTFNYGLLASGNVPRVEIINVKQATTRKPIHLFLPVYMQIPIVPSNYRYKPLNNDGVFRSGPLFHNKHALSPIDRSFYTTPIRTSLNRTSISFVPSKPTVQTTAAPSPIISVNSKHPGEPVYDDSTLEMHERI